MVASLSESFVMSKILVIDDNHQLRHVVCCILEREGHSVVWAGDGIEGLATFRAELPDLVITDMCMPGLDGADTIVGIRQEAPNTRIIAISGGGHIDGLHPLTVARRLGAVETLGKPFTIDDLVSSVTRAIGSPPILLENQCLA